MIFCLIGGRVIDRLLQLRFVFIVFLVFFFVFILLVFFFLFFMGLWKGKLERVLVRSREVQVMLGDTAVRDTCQAWGKT